MKKYDECLIQVCASIEIVTTQGVDMFAWLLTVMSLIGAYLNVKKNWVGFLLWAIVDIGWAIYDYYIGEYAQSFLFMCYFGLAAWGLFSWYSERKKEIPKNG